MTVSKSTIVLIALLSLTKLMGVIGAKNEGLTLEGCRKHISKILNYYVAAHEDTNGWNAEKTYLYELCKYNFLVHPINAISKAVTNPSKPTICDLPEVVTDICKEAFKTKYLLNQKLEVDEDRYKNYEGCVSKTLVFSDLNDECNSALKGRTLKQTMAPCYTKDNTYWTSSSKEKDFIYVGVLEHDDQVKIAYHAKLSDDYMKIVTELAKKIKAQKKEEEKKQRKSSNNGDKSSKCFGGLCSGRNRKTSETAAA